MAIDYESIGKRIKQFRVNKGMSQTELANIIYVNNQHISRAESGKVTLSLDLVVSIANALDVSADDLLAENLNVTSSAIGDELSIVFSKCNNTEKAMFIEIFTFLKSLFDKYGI